MKFSNTQAITGLILSATLLMSACSESGGSSSVSTVANNDFSFPAVTEAGNSIEIPEGSTPAFSARRSLSKGTGSVIEYGEPVVIEYNMYSWSTGELVESTDTFDEPYTLRAGVSNGAPEYLTKSLLGRQVGETIQIVFEQGMEDLPFYFDNEDAYVLVVNIL